MKELLIIEDYFKEASNVKLFFEHRKFKCNMVHLKDLPKLNGNKFYYTSNKFYKYAFNWKY